MINKLILFSLNIVKSNLSLIVVFYACGFLSFISHYYILGLPQISGNAQTYAELAGRNIITILESFVYLINEPGFLIAGIQSENLTWAGNSLYTWVATVFLLIIAQIAFKFFANHPFISALAQKPYLTSIQLALLFISVLCCFNIQTQPLYIKNVLQPVDFVNFHFEKERILKHEKKLPAIDYENRWKKIAEFTHPVSESVNKAEKIKAFFFASGKRYNLSGNDERRLSAFMLMILMVTLTAMLLALYQQQVIGKWLIFCFTLAEFIFIPVNYGILGIEYQYPVISLDYGEKNKPLHKEGVFLLAKSQDNLIIYDRLNFFQISYIPQNSILNIEQVFTSSPFSNCADGEFKPCEIYAFNP